MTEKEFLYAALCDGGVKGEKQAQAYIEKNPKYDYDNDDWMKAMCVKRGFNIPNRPGWTRMSGGGKTTCFGQKTGFIEDDEIGRR